MPPPLGAGARLWVTICDRGCCDGGATSNSSFNLAFSRAFFSWIPPSWKLAGSKMIESPLGRLVGASTLTGANEGAWSIDELDTGLGNRSSPPPKLNTSKEKARSRLWKIGKSESLEALLSKLKELRSEKSNEEAEVVGD